MKKTGLLLLSLCLAAAAAAQDAGSEPAAPEAPQGTISTAVNFPIERVETPSAADLYCAGFVNKQLLPNANFVAGGLNTPNTTKFINQDMIYVMGHGYQTGQVYSVVRELRDPNRFEMYDGQHAMVQAMGQPYADLGRVRIVDTRHKAAIAYVEFSCEPIDPGDILIPFTERPAISYHPPLKFDRFAPANHGVSGRIVLAKDFDSQLGTGAKVYMNVGSNQGVKVGDYFRAVRPYTYDLHDPVDSLSFAAYDVVEDTQRRPPSLESHLFRGTDGPVIHVADLPRRSVGELVVLSITPTTATGMIVFALEDVHIGDGVEIDQQ